MQLKLINKKSIFGEMINHIYCNGIRVQVKISLNGLLLFSN